VTVLEGASAWANGTHEETVTEAALFAEAAAELHAPLVLAFALDPVIANVPATERNLATLAAAVADAGATLCVEFLPFSGVPDLATAWRLVEPLGPGAALTIDTWHWKRQPGGPCRDLLATIPGDRIAYVQVSDCASDPATDLRMETMLARRLPGTGAIDFDEFFSVLSANGAQPFVAPEVFNPSLVRDLGPVGAAQAARSATEKILAGHWQIKA
jgi:sugar phosphate isomerase/epimerase